MAVRAAVKRASTKRSKPRVLPGRVAGLVILAGVAIGLVVVAAQAEYTFTWQSPVRVRLQSPLLIVRRSSEEESRAVQLDQAGRKLTAHQQYACNKFGAACRVALAIQRAENPRGACEIYHYNTDGTLDWGYFQINTVHLKRPGLNLRDLLDCKANIDFAYQLYTERGFDPWTTFTSGAYRKFLANF
jgi:hypothetical protein